MDDDDEISLENQYYQAKSEWQESGDVDDALENFQIVIDLDAEKPSVWGFRALKQSLKILLQQINVGSESAGASGDGGKIKKYEQQIRHMYEQILEYSRGDAVTKNQSEKAINAVLDRASALSRSSQGNADLSLQERLYSMTLQSLRNARNDRLWFSTMLKLARICFETRQYQRMQKMLKQLQQYCKTPIFHDKTLGRELLQKWWQAMVDKYRTMRQEGKASESVPPPINAQHMTMYDFVNFGIDIHDANIREWVDDRTKGTQVLETYALEIQLYTEQRNNKMLAQIYQKCMNIRSAIPHPRIMGVIRECGGKMYMREKQWGRSQEDFFEAFKSYDEAGEPRRIQCLKYLMLANMLSVSKINPLEANECKPYRDHPEMRAMTDLLHAYQQRDIMRFERILRNNRSTITESDTFIHDHIRELLVTMRTQVLLKMVRPYSRIRIPYLAQQLNIGDSEEGITEVEHLLVSLILDERIDAHIDQINRILIIHNRTSSALTKKGKGIGVEAEDEEEAQTQKLQQKLYSRNARYEQCERWARQLRQLMRTIHNKV